ncbi:MAG: DUF1223 domain-containing protein [Parvibaculaceae bacterium]|nr:DUF1223 domain-containing protein [Parvibaculaceae bacterium]
MTKFSVKIANRTALLASLLWAGLGTLNMVPTAHAAESRAMSPVVVELFTSQGCSSCPPADAYMNDLSQREDVLALSLPVDYWDYLGWKDTLASPAHTNRQRAYQKALGTRNVYTPQMVINGQAHAVGSRRPLVEEAIAEQRTSRTTPPSMHFDKQGDILELKVGASALPHDQKHATLWLVRYNKETPVTIERGENRGKAITYVNVVREMMPIGMWTGKAVTIDIPIDSLMAQGYDGCAAILQADGQGPILAAAELNLSDL